MSEPDLQRFWDRLRPSRFAMPGVRDPQGPCEEFNLDGYNGKGTCKSDGHYLCTLCSHLSPQAPRFTEYGRDGRLDRLRLFWRRPMEPTHTDFWDMARDIRAYCKETGLTVVVHDDQEHRRIGFTTGCAASDPRFKHWNIRLGDVSLTANKRPVDFEGLSNDDLLRITHPWLMSGHTRHVVAEYLSTGQLPPLVSGGA